VPFCTTGGKNTGSPPEFEFENSRMATLSQDALHARMCCYLHCVLWCSLRWPPPRIGSHADQASERTSDFKAGHCTLSGRRALMKATQLQ
jgi:hypothetical protein